MYTRRAYELTIDQILVAGLKRPGSRDASVPHVGVGKCLGFEVAEAFEAQCCWVRPGNGLLITGAMGQVMSECAMVAYQLISAYEGVITKRLEPSAQSPLFLMKAGQGVHIHIAYNIGRDISHGLYKGAMVVALLSLLVKRCPREDTAIVGDVTCLGGLCPLAGGWTLPMIGKCLLP